MEHPITPPSELVERWRDEALNSFPDDANPCPCDIDDARDEYIAIQSARWGADQELEACCEWLNFYAAAAEAADLRAARRPKPLSLKQQALEALGEERAEMSIQNYMAIRSVLESLPDPQD